MICFICVNKVRRCLLGFGEALHMEQDHAWQGWTVDGKAGIKYIERANLLELRAPPMRYTHADDRMAQKREREKKIAAYTIRWNILRGQSDRTGYPICRTLSHIAAPKRLPRGIFRPIEIDFYLRNYFIL